MICGGRLSPTRTPSTAVSTELAQVPFCHLRMYRCYSWTAYSVVLEADTTGPVSLTAPKESGIWAAPGSFDAPCHLLVGAGFANMVSNPTVSKECFPMDFVKTYLAGVFVSHITPGAVGISSFPLPAPSAGRAGRQILSRQPHRPLSTPVGPSGCPPGSRGCLFPCSWSCRRQIAAGGSNRDHDHDCTSAVLTSFRR